MWKWWTEFDECHKTGGVLGKIENGINTFSKKIRSRHFWRVFEGGILQALCISQISYVASLNYNSVSKL